MLRAAESDTVDEALEGSSKKKNTRVECHKCHKRNLDPLEWEEGCWVAFSGDAFLEVAQLWNLFSPLCLLGSFWLS